jgi:hypothetical protein
MYLGMIYLLTTPLVESYFKRELIHNKFKKLFENGWRTKEGKVRDREVFEVGHN